MSQYLAHLPLPLRRSTTALSVTHHPVSAKISFSFFSSFMYPRTKFDNLCVVELLTIKQVCPARFLTPYTQSWWNRTVPPLERTWPIIDTSDAYYRFQIAFFLSKTEDFKGQIFHFTFSCTIREVSEMFESHSGQSSTLPRNVLDVLNLFWDQSASKQTWKQVKVWTFWPPL